MRIKIKRNIKEGPKEITPFKLSNTQDKIATQIEEFYAKKKRYSGIEEIGEWNGYELRKIVGKFDKTHRWFLYDDGVPKLFVQFSDYGDPQGLQINNIRKTEGGFNASDFYKFLMEQQDINPNGILYSDSQQTPGGKSIWSQLDADPDIEVEDLGKVLRAKFKVE
tara:strand:+ start:102 stop:596 length:495 start_codon:yes stop_codon:yes gene_type:complete